MLKYAGIGARETPEGILGLMSFGATELMHMGFRS